jgi:hypothetical protein
LGFNRFIYCDYINNYGLAFNFAFATMAQSQSSIRNCGALFPSNNVATMPNSSSYSPVFNDTELLNGNNANGQHSDFDKHDAKE